MTSKKIIKIVQRQMPNAIIAEKPSGVTRVAPMRKQLSIEAMRDILARRDQDKSISTSHFKNTSVPLGTLESRSPRPTRRVVIVSREGVVGAQG